MKWTDELDIELKKLVSLDKRYKEISIIMNRSVNSIRNRCNRLGLKIKYDKLFTCDVCNNSFKIKKFDNRKFCSHICAAKTTNVNRILSDETKLKIKNTLLRYNKLIVKDKKEINRNCKLCKTIKITKKYKTICDDCRITYYKCYRPACKFDFNVFKYKNRFNLELVKMFGWYSPSNKKNNLNGVSKDHLYSVRDGFINKIPPEIIKHPANCSLLKHSDNNIKNYNSSITIEELYIRIKNWE